MPKRVAILQSSYIPWKGYFDIIHDVDEFVFLDDVQYTNRDWRSRNLIKTDRGRAWLTIPVGHIRRGRLICDVELRPDWAESHWRKLESSYARAPHYAAYAPLLRELYLATRWQYLSDFNQNLIRTIAREILGVQTVFRDSRELRALGRKEDRLLEILEAVEADVYVSGPAAKTYIDADRFAAAGVELVWKDYDGYPEYPQFHPPFNHQVTILDLLFHVGPRAPWYIWGWRADGA